MRVATAAVWLTAALVIAAGAAQGQTAATGLFAEGNDLYRKGQFALARQRYLSAAQTGVRDARLYYNLGNACFKDGDLGEAVLWYERALRLDPRDEDALANLRFLRHIKRDQETADGGGAAGFLYRFYLWPTLNELLAGTSLCLLGVFGAACWRLWRGLNLAVAMTLALAGAATLGAGSFAALRLHRQATLVEAVVTAPEGTARSGPGSTETVVFAVHEGTKVTVERREGGWLLVRLASGLGGWLPPEVVTVI